MEKNLPQFYHKSWPKKAEKVYWQGLSGSAAGFGIASMVGPSPLVVITQDAVTAYRLEQELRFFLGQQVGAKQILTFPGWETLPYDHFSPHEEVVSQRELVLYQLLLDKPKVVLVDAATLMYRLPPKSYLESNSFVLEVGEEVDFGLLRRQLESYGYSGVIKVMEHGEFAVRGSIIDVFPMGSQVPYRIDFLNTTVDSIRIFDVDTQLSLKTIANIKLLPAKEFPINDEAIDRFSTKWRSHFSGDPLKCSLYQSVKAKTSHPGIEYYLPLFFEETATFFDYLPSDSIVITVDEVEKGLQEFWHEIAVRYEQLGHDQERPILAPAEIFITPEQVTALKNSFAEILINGSQLGAQTAPADFIAKVTDNILVGSDPKNMVLNLQHTLKTLSQVRALFIVESIGRQEALLKILHDAKIFPEPTPSWQTFMQSKVAYSIAIAPIERPMHLIFGHDQSEVLLITEAKIFGETIIQTRAKKLLPKKVDSMVRNLTELQVGDPVVHIDYGIGRYLGLQKLPVNNYESEFLVLEYAEGAKLYVPVAALGLISRYTGMDVDQVPLHHLGSKQWDKTKAQAEKQIRDTAAELLEIYANRLKAQGFAFTQPSLDYERFTAAFPFVVTPDQQRAIDEVLADMTSGRKMDRLICGDVGFGKTEVAMRAAFLAAYNGKQVAILAPTTLLAQQHFTNFQDRFATWPMKIALFSRMGETAALKKVEEGLANGEIDIVIGTHKLLQKNIRFKNLGLLVIDEEHRFGVRQKETIKNLASQIDILALTATPIPRSLNMAFAGIRDFSIISTPPAKRLSIKTFICEEQPYLIKEAILRETLRGGQVYFLHNNIMTIEKMARELKNLVPGINLAIAHGQMRKQQLESIMRDFYHLHINVLVCTTIIESGIDVPTANTIIINRADKFGLAQLHQLRGRVGRSHHQAYAYLIVPPIALLSSEAKKRLEAIEAMRDLGTGFALAINDLEIRGAGELLGEKQSGVMQGIGFNLYMEMLERAVKFLKKGEKLVASIPSDAKTEIELPIAALIPDQYVADVNLRLVLYKKIADAKNQAELDALQVEMIDRFGLLPEPVKNLIRLAELRQLAQSLKIAKVKLGQLNKGSIEFIPDANLDPRVVLKVIQKYTISYKFIGSNTIEFVGDIKTTKLDFIALLLGDFVLR